MKRILLALSTFICVSVNAQTVIYDLGNTDLFNMTPTGVCNPTDWRPPSTGSIWGFDWTSTNGNTPVSVVAEVYQRFDTGQGPYPVTLNSNAETPINPPAYSCVGTVETINLTPANYNPLGLNSVRVDHNPNGQNLVDANFSWGNTVYVRVTVDYGTPCVNPSTPNLSVSPSSICLGESATITTTGTLNDATDWVLYSSSCGGTLEDQNVTGSFTASPSASGWYYVRGEGGCTSPGNCDSILIMVNVPPFNGVTQNGAELTAVSGVATYQWLDCDNNYAVIPGATSQIFTATTNGNYAVEVTEFGCSDTSACYAVTNIGFESFASGGINMYPNPVDENLIIQISIPSEVKTVTVLNGLGEEVISRNIEDQKILLDVNKLAPGLYYVQLELDGERFIERLVKK